MPLENCYAKQMIDLEIISKAIVAYKLESRDLLDAQLLFLAQSKISDNARLTYLEKKKIIEVLSLYLDKLKIYSDQNLPKTKEDKNQIIAAENALAEIKNLIVQTDHSLGLDI